MLLLPRQQPPEVLLLKLVRLHDTAAVNFGPDWATGRKEFSLRVNEDHLESLCTQLSRKAPAWRRVCRHLVGTREPVP